MFGSCVTSEVKHTRAQAAYDGPQTRRAGFFRTDHDPPAPFFSLIPNL